MALIGYSQNLTVAVDNFTARSGYSEAELGNITELFAGFLLETRQFRVLTRSQWGAILKEQNFQLSGFVADEEIRKLGAALGASAVITGSLMKLGNSNILNISLLNVESGEMQSAARRTFESLDDLLDLMPALSADIARMVQPPSPFVGTWGSSYIEKGTGNSGSTQWVWEFNNDGTFIISSYSRNTSYRLGMDVSVQERRASYRHIMINGIVRGTYTYTNASLTLNYTITGTREYAIGSDNYYKDNNYNERGVCTVSYTISSNRRTITLDVRENELFHLLIREDYDRNDFREHRVNTLIKR
jgi:TolB-like protein